MLRVYFFLAIFIAANLVACSITPGGSFTMGNKYSAAYWDSAAEECRDGIRKLRVGMTRAEVERLLPNPFLVEAPGDGREYLLYVTTAPRGVITSNNLTPVAFEDGKVIGWGRNFFVNKEQKYDIRVR